MALLCGCATVFLYTLERIVIQPKKAVYGFRGYAIEELTAELTAAYLCVHLGIDGKLQHASYLKNWSQLLKDHPKAFLSAASNASKAADYLRDFSKKV